MSRDSTERAWWSDGTSSLDEGFEQDPHNLLEDQAALRFWDIQRQQQALAAHQAGQLQQQQLILHQAQERLREQQLMLQTLQQEKAHQLQMHRLQQGLMSAAAARAPPPGFDSAPGTFSRSNIPQSALPLSAAPTGLANAVAPWQCLSTGAPSAAPSAGFPKVSVVGMPPVATHPSNCTTRWGRQAQRGITSGSSKKSQERFGASDPATSARDALRLKGKAVLRSIHQDSPTGLESQPKSVGLLQRSVEEGSAVGKASAPPGLTQMSEADQAALKSLEGLSIPHALTEDQQVRLYL